MKAVKKAVKTLQQILDEELEKTLELASERVKSIIMDAYDSRTSMAVIDRRSKTNPQDPKYRDKFMEALNSFEFFQKQDSKVAFVIPDMENFDFSNSKLMVIQQIMEGTAGIYVEVSAEDFEKMFGKRSISKEPFDTSVPKRDLIYLMRYNNIVRTAERRVFGQGYLVRYPFSNTPPMRIFDDAEKFANEELDKMLKEAINTSIIKLRKAV